jgi:hypothetical protein
MTTVAAAWAVWVVWISDHPRHRNQRSAARRAADPRYSKASQRCGAFVFRGNFSLHSGALQRLASMASDRNDFALAWDLFGQARQIDPTAVSLSHLEVTMLFNEGRDDEAKHCAALWIQRLTRLRDPQLQPLITYLRDLQRDGLRMLENIDEENFLRRFAAE